MIVRASKNIIYKYYFGLLILSFLFLYNCSEKPNTTFTTFDLNISGTVIDSEYLFPISNATVTIGQKFYNPWHGTSYGGLQSVTTNENGQYRFDPESIIHCNIHEISVSVSKKGYKPSSGCNLICVEDNQICDFALVRSNR